MYPSSLGWYSGLSSWVTPRNQDSQHGGWPSAWERSKKHWEWPVLHIPHLKGGRSFLRTKYGPLITEIRWAFLRPLALRDKWGWAGRTQKYSGGGKRAIEDNRRVWEICSLSVCVTFNERYQNMKHLQRVHKSNTIERTSMLRECWHQILNVFFK